MKRGCYISNDFNVKSSKYSLCSNIGAMSDKKARYKQYFHKIYQYYVKMD